MYLLLQIAKNMLPHLQIKDMSFHFSVLALGQTTTQDRWKREAPKSCRGRGKGKNEGAARPGTGEGGVPAEFHPIVTLPRGPALTHRDTVRRRRLQCGESRARPQQDDAIRRPDQACNTALCVIARARTPLGRPPPPCASLLPGAHPRPPPRAWRARCAVGTARPRARPNSPPWRQGRNAGIARGRAAPPRDGARLRIARSAGNAAAPSPPLMFPGAPPAAPRLFA